ncbi:hydrogenase-4 component F [Streptomyces sp. Amel2xB2]|uniref:proton-conducting transporter transmembrane domain-containing protein n=1 Tax=Streptomyces sp. Amel2xB2 TaxID=1305829 RepID=UPI000DB9DA6D|nr:proton-conducting transporter membrane subunit [Streptomyces sp. Amel2xB2]RAJ58812.1 hydrogenase-4 component F [Streptomyces sp. Amel2xB2]
MNAHASALWLCAPVAVPLAVAALYGAARRRPLTPWAALVSPAAVLGAAAALSAPAAGGGAVPALGGLLRADALTVWMLLAVGAVALPACAAGPAYLAGERAAGRGGERFVRRYQVLVHLFLGAMCTAVLTANLGVLWAAVEATTIVTAFLVGHRRTRASVEAAWKYVVICSAGIALAFLGIVLIHHAARAAGVPEESALDWPTLLAYADHFDPPVIRLATALVLLGFGAKAGLVPLHAWLPDAHSQAPAPVSALMSGVLLSVSFMAVLRCKAIADAALGTGYTRVLLTAMALLTLALAAGLLLGQRDYKRMLAYSSMEHMSLIALGAAVGTPLALSAVLLHITGHGLAKTVAFCSSGHLLQLRGTSRIDEIRGLLAQAPALGAAFGLAVLALLGLPPFSLFASELGIVRAGFAAGLGGPTAVALVLVLIAFGALSARTARMLLDGRAVPSPAPADAPSSVPERGEGSRGEGSVTAAGSGAARSRTALLPVSGTQPPETEARPVRLGFAAGLPLVLGLSACAALGVAAGPLTRLLAAGAAVIGGQ